MTMNEPPSGPVRYASETRSRLTGSAPSPHWPSTNLMADEGEGVIYMPGAEFDDSTTLVVKSNSTIFLSAQIGRKEGFRRPADFVSVERVVQVVDQPTSR